MMAPTHVATGLAIAVPVATVAPEYAAAAVAGSTVGSLVPDLDLLVGEHRRTLHFPTLGWVVAVPVALAAVVTPSAVTVGVALCALSFAVHLNGSAEAPSSRSATEGSASREGRSALLRASGYQ